MNRPRSPLAVARLKRAVGFFIVFVTAQTVTVVLCNAYVCDIFTTTDCMYSVL